MEVESGKAVRIELKDGRIRFGILDADLPIAESNGWFRPKCDKFYYYTLDPLTTRINEGLEFSLAASIAKMSLIRELPITTDFVIDSVDMLSEYLLRTQREQEGSVALARNFILLMIEWLQSHGGYTHEADVTFQDQIRRCHLTDFGLDFMRQHYRAIREAVVAEQKLPTKSTLECLFRQTKFHPTTDADWCLDDML